MKKRSSERTLFLCEGALIAALYVSLTFLSSLIGLDKGVIQIRFSEMLCVLPVLMPAAIPGLTVGCLLSNLLFGGTLLDIIFGTLATLIGAYGTYLLRKIKWLAPLPAVLSNALIIPFVLAYGYNAQEAIPLMMLTVGAGELISVYGLGFPLLVILKRRVFNDTDK